MKKLIVLAACVGATSLALGQGAFNLNNKVNAAAIDAPVSMAMGGALLSGADGWVVQATMSTTANGAFAPVGTAVSFRTGAAIGYFAGGAVDTGLASGTDIFVALQAWNTNDGATYAAAEAAGGAVGMSNVVPVTVDGPPNTPPNLTGLVGWQVGVIPEPSTMALGLLGIGALMLRRRR
jgi:hypothetical protein